MIGLHLLPGFNAPKGACVSFFVSQQAFTAEELEQNGPAAAFLHDPVNVVGREGIGGAGDEGLGFVFGQGAEDGRVAEDVEERGAESVRGRKLTRLVI